MPTTLIATLVIALGPVLTPVQAAAPATRPAPAPPAGRPAQPTPAPAVAVPSDYTIGTDDVLGVVFWREPDLSGDVTVRPDGRITLPVIGEMEAAGLRPEELRERVLGLAAKYIADANVQVVVRTINSRKIFVTGRVVSPGAHPLTGPLTATQAISLAGGLTEYADAKNITIIRHSGAQTQSFRLNYKDVSRGKSLEQDIRLRPGDTIIVP